MSELEEIKRIKTRKDGIAIIEVEYKYGGNVNEQYQEVVREVNNMRGTLPENILSIDITKPSPTDVNILQMALVSENAPREQLKKQAESLQDELEKINTLQKVEISDYKTNYEGGFTVGQTGSNAYSSECYYC
jgi:multidrug efflux pump subunit AcrB